MNKISKEVITRLEKDDIYKPRLAKNADTFYLMVLQFAETIVDIDDEKSKAEFISIGIRLIMHEYLASVLNGNIKPYQQGAPDKEDLEDFYTNLSKVKMNLASIGIPMKEGEYGEIGIDYEKMFNDKGEDIGTCGAIK